MHVYKRTAGAKQQNKGEKQSNASGTSYEGPVHDGTAEPTRCGVRYLAGGLKVYYLPWTPMFDVVAFPTAFVSLPLLRNILIRESIDIVHAHQSTSVLGHECSFHALTCSRRVVFTDHSLHSIRANSACIHANKITTVGLTNVNHAICVSHVLKENLVLKSGCPAESISVIPNAIDCDKFTPAPLCDGDSDQYPDVSSDRDLRLLDEYGDFGLCRSSNKNLSRAQSFMDRAQSSARHTSSSIPLGLPANWIGVEELPFPWKRRLTVVLVSRLTFRKGTDLMASVIPKICQAYPFVDFIIGGDGNRREQIEEAMGPYKWEGFDTEIELSNPLDLNTSAEQSYDNASSEQVNSLKHSNDHGKRTSDDATLENSGRASSLRDNLSDKPSNGERKSVKERTKQDEPADKNRKREGDRPTSTELPKRRVLGRATGRVHMTGALKNAEVVFFLRRGDFFLNTSLTETFCIAILEAASTGLKVISTNVGGVPEVLPAHMVVLSEPDPDPLFLALEKTIMQYIDLLRGIEEAVQYSSAFDKDNARNLDESIDDSRNPLRNTAPHGGDEVDTKHGVYDTLRDLGEAEKGIHKSPEINGESTEKGMNPEGKPAGSKAENQKQRNRELLILAKLRWRQFHETRRLYSWNDVAKRTDRVYQSVMSNPPLKMRDRLLRIPQRLRYMSGVLYALVLVADWILFQILEVAFPANQIEKVKYLA